MVTITSIQTAFLFCTGGISAFALAIASCCGLVRVGVQLRVCIVLCIRSVRVRTSIDDKSAFLELIIMHSSIEAPGNCARCCDKHPRMFNRGAQYARVYRDATVQPSYAPVPSSAATDSQFEPYEHP